MKLLLIHPILGEMPKEQKKKRRAIFPPLNLAIIAALTPPDIEVEIIDENLEDINYDTDADLIGITVMTAAANRAYKIADRFRSLGKKVVLGGMHVTALPDEAQKHADAVCVGEAENYWQELIEDYKQKQLKPRYGPGERLTSFWTPFARRDLFKSDRYIIKNTLQTTRGCPFICDFCTVSQFFGRTYRFRPIADIVEEVKQFSNQLVAFVDDNIVGHFKRAKELFKALIPLNIKWVSQASINIAKDDELLELAAASGCIGLFIGFESLVDENLKAMRKNVNKISFFEKAIKKIHSYGIAIEGAFIFGLDEDNESVFKRTVKFAKRMRLEAAQFGILTPFPGTGLFKKLAEEKRIFDFNWSHYDIARVVFQPKKMSAQTLQDGFNWAWREFYSIPSIIRRLSFNKIKGNFPWVLNFAFRRSVKHSKVGQKVKIIQPQDNPNLS